MKIDRTDFLALVPRITSGELTRAAAAELASAKTGLSKSTFLVWLSQQKLELPHANAGARNVRSHARTDPDKAKAYADALSAVLSGAPGAATAKKYGVNYTHLMNQVRKHRVEPSKRPSPERLIQRIRDLRTELAAAEAELEALLQPT